MGTTLDMSAAGVTMLHLGTLHPAETVGVAVLALGPIVALACCVVATVRKERRLAAEEEEGERTPAKLGSGSAS